jgi:hypothetical protein
MYNVNQLFISQYESSYSRSSIHVRGIGNTSFFLKIQLKDFISPSKVRHIFQKIFWSDVVCIMSPSHLLVIPIAIITRKKIVLDAGWPLSDSTMTSTDLIYRNLTKIKNYFIDFTSFNLSSEVILESQTQADRIHKKFKIHRRKMKVIYTGVDEARFRDLEEKQPKEASAAKALSFVLFRGKYNREAGIEPILDFFKNNSKLCLVLAVPDIPEKFRFPPNVIAIKRELSDAEMKWLYLNAIIALGQFGQTKRQDYSVPHKFYEAAYFGCPYLSPNKIALNEPELSSSFINCNDLNNFREFNQIGYLKEKGLQSKNNYDLYLSNEILREKFAFILNPNSYI